MKRNFAINKQKNLLHPSTMTRNINLLNFEWLIITRFSFSSNNIRISSRKSEASAWSGTSNKIKGGNKKELEKGFEMVLLKEKINLTRTRRRWSKSKNYKHVPGETKTEWNLIFGRRPFLRWNFIIEECHNWKICYITTKQLIRLIIDNRPPLSPIYLMPFFFLLIQDSSIIVNWGKMD